MAFITRAIAFALSGFVLASCGGGGGGGGTGSTPIGSNVQPVALSESSAKPVAASALDATVSSSATSGAGLPLGVQAGPAASASTVQVLAEAARFAASSFAAAALPTGISVSQTVACTLGGTMTITGNVASPAGLSVGDSITASMSNCGLSETGTPMTMNGQIAMTIVSGTVGTPPFHAVLQTTATNLSVQTGGVTVVANGDARLDWNAASASSQTLTASGARITNVETTNGSTHTMTMRDYTQTRTISGTTVSSSLNATIETDSSRIASTPVRYTVATSTPVTWNTSTGAVTAGVVKVTGANASQLVLTINPDGTAAIQVDANGDGTFETTITTTVAELHGLI